MSFAAALAQGILAVLGLAFSRAPGSEHLRWFAAVAGTAAAYSALNTLFSLELAESTLTLAGRTNLCIAHLHVAAWIVYARAWHRAPLSAHHRRLIIALALPAMLSLVPGLYLLEEVRAVWLPDLHTYYQQVSLTHFGEIGAAFLLAVLVIPFSEFFRSWRAGKAGAGMHVAAFVVFLAGSLNELLVGSAVVTGPYWADLAFMAIVVIVAIEMVNRSTRDARELLRLSGQLGREVERRGVALRNAEDVLVQSERLSALGRLAAGVGHEINNPLSYVLLNLEYARAQPGLDPEVDRCLADATDGALRIRRVTRDLRLFARADAGRPGACELEAVVDSAVRLATPELRRRAQLSFEYLPAPLVAGDPARLAEVVSNLLMNAAHAIAEDEAPRHRIVIRTDTTPDGWARLTISDTGAGLSEQAREHAFEPFFATRGPQTSAGLGMAICHGIVAAMGGRIEIDSVLEVGTTVTVTLPPADEALPRLEITRPDDLRIGSRPATKKSGRVLIIDDDELVAAALSHILSAHDVQVAAGGRAGLEVLTRNQDWDAVLCDLMMPDLTGMQLAAEIERRWPALKARLVYLTGGAFTEQAQEFLARPAVFALRKPVDSALLRRVVAAVVAGESPTVPDDARP